MLGWADDFARLKVYANADTPAAAQRARALGAVGIGLCRTERMFNAVDRLPIVQDMILAEGESERHAALDKLLPIQREDFAGIFRAMDGVSDEDSALVNVLLNEYRTGARFSKFAEPREDSLPNDEYPVRRG